MYFQYSPIDCWLHKKPSADEGVPCCLHFRVLVAKVALKIEDGFRGFFKRLARCLIKLHHTNVWYALYDLLKFS